MRNSALFFIFVLTLFTCDFSYAQSPREKYEAFKRQTLNKYNSFREECSKKYAEHLRNTWATFESKAAIPNPKDISPLPPILYKGDGSKPSVDVEPTVLDPILETPQPVPLEQIDEEPEGDENHVTVDFYGLSCNVRFPELISPDLGKCSSENIAKGWEVLCNADLNTTLNDCLEIRTQCNLCDWAYLIFLNRLASKYFTNANEATLLTAFLYCQSGYQMRLAVDRANLVLLFGSKHQIYNKGFFTIGGECFYPLGDPANSISICPAAFEGEKPMSLAIYKEQLFGYETSKKRNIASPQINGISATCQVPVKLIDFFNTYPSSSLNNNTMSKWTVYANMPLSKRTKEELYPSLYKYIEGKTKLQASELLLNWVQTGFEYEYDDKVWGHDRAFFAEETLYYPYCDCEDRSILFSRLIRDLLDLDVALIYYPGHLATAVCFNEDVAGDAMIIDGRKFIVCDPTYIGAPVGVQMPDLEYDKARAIVLNR